MDTQTPALHQLCEVRGAFTNPAAMQAAVSELTLAGFDRADLALPEPGHSLDEVHPESSAKPVATESDARQMRTLGSSTAAAAAAIAAAGITVATGGAAAPVIAAAVIAGGVAGGATYAATAAAAGAEQRTRENQAAAGVLVLSVRTTTPAKVATARTVLYTAGAINIETIE